MYMTTNDHSPNSSRKGQSPLLKSAATNGTIVKSSAGMQSQGHGMGSQTTSYPTTPVSAAIPNHNHMVQGHFVQQRVLHPSFNQSPVTSFQNQHGSDQFSQTLRTEYVHQSPVLNPGYAPNQDYYNHQNHCDTQFSQQQC